jgi:hypothetical protein
MSNTDGAAVQALESALLELDGMPAWATEIKAIFASLSGQLNAAGTTAGPSEVPVAAPARPLTLTMIEAMLEEEDTKVIREGDEADQSLTHATVLQMCDPFPPPPPSPAPLLPSAHLHAAATVASRGQQLRVQDARSH